jgi:hypothetical protein
MPRKPRSLVDGVVIGTGFQGDGLRLDKLFALYAIPEMR